MEEGAIFVQQVINNCGIVMRLREGRQVEGGLQCDDHLHVAADDEFCALIEYLSAIELMARTTVGHRCKS
jgi:hypothetical protein